jgi:two-component system, NarL family, response regulator
MPTGEIYPIRILIVDDHPVMCSGLSNMLGTQERMIVVGTTGSGAEALKLVAHLKPDLMLLDLRMPGMEGISVLRALALLPSPPKVLVLTSYEQDELIYQAIKAGAQGYLLKDTSETELIAAITAVHAGKRYIPIDIASRLAERMMRSDLTPRELQTLELLAKGSTNKQIAAALNLSDYTIRHYINNIMEKLKVSDRTEAVAIAFKSGLLSHLGG